MAAPTKRRLTAEERRSGILDAALAVFSQRGYHDSSIDDIASEAGVSKALIYEHFASKQELYGDLIARNARELTQRLAGALVGLEFESSAERARAHRLGQRIRIRRRDRSLCANRSEFGAQCGIGRNCYWHAARSAARKSSEKAD